MSLSLVTGASQASQAIELDTVKAHCNLEGVDDRDLYLVHGLIPAAIDRAEQATQRALLRQVWALQLDQFPCDEAWIEIPKPPLVSVISVTYVDASGVTQTWDASQYLVDAPAGPRARRGRLLPAYGESWPSTRAQMNAVTVTFRCGYGEGTGASVTTRPEDVPSLLRHGLLLDVGTMFLHREDTGTIVEALPLTSQQIYRAFRSW